MKIDSILIVGGGSAGWMTASTLIKAFPEKNISIVEPKSIPRIGVGESTLQNIRLWLDYLGIKDSDWMKDCDAVYKLSIKFTDFYEKNYGSFHYPFGQPNVSDTFDGVNDWFFLKPNDSSIDENDFCRSFWCQMKSIEENKIPNSFESFDFEKDTAFHFDALKFADWLKNNYAIPRGVNLIEDEIESIEKLEDGSISYLHLKSNKKVTADLFIDCTGFKSLLLENGVGSKFISFEDILPNNRAWAVAVPYLDKEKEIEVYTNCTAIENGWCWNIPQWSKIGCGYVYSDRHVSPDQALIEFKSYLNSDKMKLHCPERTEILDLEFRDIKIRTGYSEKIWYKNVVGIGLSAAFIEPLESNGLLTVHEFLVYLVETLSNRPKVTSFDIDCFNLKATTFVKGFMEFVALHYAFSIRDDTEYWKNYTQTYHFLDQNLDNSINLNILVESLVKSKRFSFASLEGLCCISAGFNISPSSKIHTQRNCFSTGNDIHLWKSNFKFLEERKNRWYNINETFPSAFDFYSNVIYGS